MQATIGDIRMHWRESGRGDPVLFVHGFPFHGGLWEEQVDRLPQRWHWLAPDLRGFGTSEIGPGDGPLGMDLLADDLVAFLDARGVERAVVCGLSMGGYIAFALWRWHPERVRALVLCSTRAGADTDEARERRHALAERVRKDGAAAAVAALVPGLLSEETRRGRPEVERRVVAMIEATPTKTIVRALQGMAERPDSTDLLPRITVPTLVVAGGDDTMATAAEMELMARAIPDARHQVIAGTAHLPNLEDPTTFNRVLVHFLDAIQGH